MERRIQSLKDEHAGALEAKRKASMKQIKEAEEQASAAKVGRLGVESKLLKIELAHSSCKTHIAELLASVERVSQDAKAKKEAWLTGKENWVAEKETWLAKKERWRGMWRRGLQLGMEQIKTYLCERHFSVGIDWRAVSLQDILGAGMREGGNGGEDVASGAEEEKGKEVVKEKEKELAGKKDEGTSEARKSEIREVTKASGVVIKELS